MGSIYLIRHGQASLGAANYDVLSPLGAQQSQILGSHLRNSDIRFDRACSGLMQRQLDTARHALDSMQQPLTVEQDPAWNEYPADAVVRSFLPRLLESHPQAQHYLENAGQHRKEFQKIFSQLVSWWIDDRQPPSGCPSWSDYAEGVGEGLQRLQQQAGSGDNIAIFTSGGTITAAVQLITKMPPASAFELNWQIVNTSVTRLQFNRNRISLAGFNCRAHLDLHPDPAVVTYR